MTAPNQRTTKLLESPVTEQERLLDLRARYQQDNGLFSRYELARLRLQHPFQQWEHA